MDLEYALGGTPVGPADGLLVYALLWPERF